MPADELKALAPERLAGVDLVITSYGSLLRLPVARDDARGDLVVLDEAQAIKNPGAQQTRAAKKLAGRARIALTGTPVENRLGDLWSIFDFVNPGLLGSAQGVHGLHEAPRRAAAQPLRPAARAGAALHPAAAQDRPVVIADLPDKTEVKAFCPLSRKQAALYQQAVKELAEQLAGAEGIKRKGLVLAFLMRFKQICNHPSQWLGDGAWAEADSGKSRACASSPR